MRPAALLALLLVVEAVLTVLDLGGASLAPEERHNAHAGLLLACDHWDAIWALQYRPFCGGCTAEAVLAAPLFRGLGSTVGTWKLVPVFFHLLTVAAGGLLLGRGGVRPVLVWACLVLGLPAFARELGLTGFGNHAESMGPALLALALPGARLRPLTWPLAGALAAFSVWFCHTAAWAPVALLLTALWLSPRHTPLLLMGVPLGLWPAQLARAALPEYQEASRDWWTMHQWAPPGELRRWLWDDLVVGGLWPDQAGLPSALWWGTLWALALVGGVRALRAPDARKALPLGLLALLAAYALRHDLWSDTLPLQSYDAFNLRYRVPLLLLLLACAACAPPRLALPLGALLGAAGLWLRVNAWEGGLGALAAPLYVDDGWPDRTVPTGQPPQRLDRLMGRPSDLAAARRFLDMHDDALPECRALHEAELHRREKLSTP